MTATKLIAGSWGKGGLDLALIATDDASVLERHRCPVSLADARDRHAQVLDQQCGTWLAAHPRVPVVLSGMVGGRGNWSETVYARCPVGIDDLARQSARFEVAGHPIAIVPGASILRDGLDADVMRGEEVQILGALARHGRDGGATFCIPGTNAKWAVAKADRLTDFATYVTGDLYDHLRHRSMVGALATGDTFNNPAFCAGLDRALSLGLLNAAFAARSACLLERMKPDVAASYLSGVLIGAEIGDSERFRGSGPTLLIAGGEAATRYGQALRHLGISHIVVDAVAARLAGLAAVGRAIWG